MDFLALDVRDAVRRLHARPAFALVAAMILALGIGATTVLLSVGHAVLARPLPYAKPEQLVRLFPVRPGATSASATFSEGEYLELERRSTAFSAFTAYFPAQSVSISDGEMPVQVPASRATANVFATLGAVPTLGRPFAPEEDAPNGPRSVVLSHAFWLDRYGGDPDVVGRSIVVDGEPHVVVGVAPVSFRFPDPETRLWLPLGLDRADVNYQSGQYLGVVGRIAPEVTREQARDELERISRQLTDEALTRYAGMRIHAVDLREDLVGSARDALFVLSGVVVLVLVAVCFNLGSFFLSQVMARRSELTVRAALGAGSGRLIRTVVTDIVLLAAMGTAAGVLLASEAFRLLQLLRPAFLPRVDELALDASVLWIGSGSAVTATLLFAIGPAIQAARMGSLQALRVRGAPTGSSSSTRTRSVLVALQIAGCVVLLVGGGLLLRSLLELGRVPSGFDAEDVVTLRISLPTSSYPTRTDTLAFYQETLSRIRALPGVESAGAANVVPMSGMRSHGYAWRVEQIASADVVPQGFEMRWITPGFLETLHVPLLQGRAFDGQDAPDAPPAAILSRSLAEALWPSESAVGQRFRLGRLVDASTPWTTVVGVAGDVHQTSPQIPPEPTAYFVHGQAFAARQMSVFARTRLPLASVADAIRSEVLAVDPDRPVYAVRPMSDVVEGSISMLRFSTALVVGFAALVVVIALLGLYGLTVYTARLRAHEFTIRLILGAPPRTIVRSLLRESAALCASGVALGLAAALVLAEFLESLLFGLTPWDPATLVGAVLLVVATSFVATVVPARRATTLQLGRLLRE